jgi:hypothetical protein
LFRAIQAFGRMAENPILSAGKHLPGARVTTAKSRKKGARGSDFITRIVAKLSFYAIDGSKLTA